VSGERHLTPVADPRETLTRLGLSQTGAARLLGVNARTVRGWCEPVEAPGHRSVPTPVWRMLDLIEHVPGVRERLGEAREINTGK
jgi:DNA-binding transcriptional regulator YiaG